MLENWRIDTERWFHDSFVWTEARHRIEATSVFMSEMGVVVKCSLFVFRLKSKIRRSDAIEITAIIVQEAL